MEKVSRLPDVNQVRIMAGKRGRNDPSISTGALRSGVNSVNGPERNPSISSGTANGHFSTGKVVNVRQLLTNIACFSCAVNLS